MSDHDSLSPLGFVQKKLPWVMFCVAFLVGWATMSQSVTLDSLVEVGKVAGWDWSPKVNAPVQFLITLPIEWWVPANLQPYTLNLLTVFLSALVVYQLARSVSLLPHDRTRDQRVREPSDYSLLTLPSAWLPPVFAALTCLLQLTFWEHATALTGEMIDLLMFSFAVRALLEYRIGRAEKWLNAFALVYGVSITNNWAMIGYFPLFAVALIWVRGLGQLSLGFLGRMLLLGASGLVLYLLIPIWIVSSYPQASGITDYLVLQLGNQKNMLAGIPKSLVVVLSLTSLLPVIAMSIRWPSTLGDTSAAGAMLQNLMFKIVHLVFLGICLWVMFDPPFSPRERGLGLSFLSFYYLSALAIGYYAGYVMLVFGPLPERSASRRKHRQGGGAFLNPVFRGLIWVAAAGVPVALFLQNHPSIKLRNGPMLEAFASKQVEDLPTGKTILFVDDSIRGLLTMMGLSMSPTHNTKEISLVDTSVLSNPFYQAWIRSQLTEVWAQDLPEDKIPATIDLGSILNVIAGIIQSYPVFYAQSSFGVYFEYLYPESYGMVSQLRAYQSDDPQPLPPEPNEAAVQKIMDFWEAFDQELPYLATGVEAGERTSELLGGMVAVELNNQAAKLQRFGYAEPSGRLLNQALRYAPDLASTKVNLEIQSLIAKGESLEDVITDREWTEWIATYRSVDLMLKAIGEVNAPRFHYNLGAQLFSGGNFRQALDRFDAAHGLNSQNAKYALARASALLNLGFPDNTLSFLQEMKASGLSLEPTQEAEMVRLEGLSLFGQGNRFLATGDEDAATQSHQLAESVLLQGRKAFPKSETILDTLAQVYFFTERYQETAELCDQWLSINSRSLNALQTKAVALMRQDRFEDAMPSLNQALELSPDNRIFLLNRAICYLRQQSYDKALADYQILESLSSEPNHAVFYGLAEIARNQGDSETAIRYYEAYLKSAPPQTDEFQEVSAALEKLKSL